MRAESCSILCVKTTVSVEMYLKKLSLFSCKCLSSTLGIIEIFLTGPVESWVSTSKVLMLSTSSPKNSIRYGSSCEKENTSIIPPRTENSPGSETKSTLLNLYSKSISLTKSSESLSFTFTFKVFLSSSFLVTTCSKRASGYVTMRAGFFLLLIRLRTSARKSTLALSVSSI